MDNTCFTQYYEKYDEIRHMRQISFLLTLYYARRFEIITPNFRTAASLSGAVFRVSAPPTVKAYKMLSTYSAARNPAARNPYNEYIRAVCLDGKIGRKISRARNIENFSVNYIRELASVSKFAGHTIMKYCNIVKS